MNINRNKSLAISLLTITLSFLLLTFSIHADSRGITVKAKTSSGTIKEIQLYSGYNALVVGVSDYDSWPDLPNAVKDAHDIAYEPYTKRIPFEKGRTRDLFAVLDPKAPLKGRLYVETQPESASVRILNIGPAINQGIELDAGRYHVEVSANGYDTQKMWVSLTAGQDKTLDIHLKPVAVYQPGSQGKKVSNSLGMAFVYIAPGSFMMGSPSDEPGRGNDETQRRVTLTKGFYMQTTEVTQGQWKAVMGNNPSYFKNCGDDCPVENVSWNDVQQFIRKLNQREGSGTYKLPTEVEWEYTARAGSSSAFANGGISELQCGFDSNLDAMGWYCGNSDKRTHPAARKQPNTWGLYDMHGNVYEWCQDWYGNYPSGSVTDPTGPSSGSDRVFRGGSWSYGARNCRSADRYSYTPGYRYNNLGFRILSTGVQAESGFVTAARTVYTPVQARFPASCNCTGSNRTNRSRD
jgi:formylglycine-generating enzyme required for sulfatase activity